MTAKYNYGLACMDCVNFEPHPSFWLNLGLILGLVTLYHPKIVKKATCKMRYKTQLGILLHLTAEEARETDRYCTSEAIYYQRAP